MEQQTVKSMTNEQLIGACVWLDREQKKSRAMMNSYKAELQARGLAIMEDHNVKYVNFTVMRVVIKLTKEGVDLAEGTIEDNGVDI